MFERVRDIALVFSPAWKRHYTEVQRRNTALVETVCEITGSRVIIDSSKVALRLKYLLRNPDLDVKVIRLIRDGRAVALTYMDPANFADAEDVSFRAGGMGSGRVDGKLAIYQAAEEWRRSNKEIEHVLARLDRSRWTSIHYEDLCGSPDATRRRLFGFLEVDPDRAVGGFRSVAHHVVGNGMRLDSTTEIRLDERWKSVLTEHDIAAFDTVAGTMNRRYGYAETLPASK